MHGIGGMLGTILCGLLMSSDLGGVGFDDGLSAYDQIKIQIYSVLVTLIWTAVFTYVILKVISLIIPIRVSEEQEINGLDTSSHGESGYNI